MNPSNPSPSSRPRTCHSGRPTLLRSFALGLVTAVSLTLAPLQSLGADAPASAPAPAAVDVPQPAAAVAVPAATDSEKPTTDAPKPSAIADSPDSTTSPAKTTTPSPNERDRATRRSSRRDASNNSSRSTDRTTRRDRGGDTSGTSSSPASPGTSGTSGTDFTSFKLIAERNIFNPNRSRSGNRGDREPQKKATQVDLVTLVGTLSYSKGDFAFFDGSSSQYRKTLGAGDSIAGYSIQSITNNRIQFESAGKTVEFHVGSQLRREDEGEWKIVARSDAPSSSSSSGSTSSSKSSSASDPAANDILQRLMKKREQEK